VLSFKSILKTTAVIFLVDLINY